MIIKRNDKVSYSVEFEISGSAVRIKLCSLLLLWTLRRSSTEYQTLIKMSKTINNRFILLFCLFHIKSWGKNVFEFLLYLKETLTFFVFIVSTIVGLVFFICLAVDKHYKLIDIFNFIDFCMDVFHCLKQGYQNIEENF